jgi:hypothetical protein
VTQPRARKSRKRSPHDPKFASLQGDLPFDGLENGAFGSLKQRLNFELEWIMSKSALGNIIAAFSEDQVERLGANAWRQADHHRDIKFGNSHTSMTRPCSARVLLKRTTDYGPKTALLAHTTNFFDPRVIAT